MEEIDVHIAPLIVRHLEGTLTGGERVQLEEWLQQSDHHRALLNELQDAERLQAMLREYDAIDVDDAYTRWEYARTPRRRTLRPFWWAAAALLLLAAGAYLWNSNTQRPVIATVIEPGKEGAILTLADGSEVLLDTIQNGVVALQGGATAKVVNGKLLYEGEGEQVVYNTIRTPKGRQFQLTLPDGTEVWLDAASSIRYPTVFSGGSRQVAITGEAYFEVAADNKMPFLVNVDNRAEVQVLGTHFNINAYNNEANIKATLLEGSVKVRHAASAVTLRPGQQAQVQSTNIKIVSDPDLDKVMAWKNGLFNFEDASLEEIMRQLERWYDIEIVYEGKVPEVALMGKLTRDVTLNELLPALQKMGVHYRLEGRKLTILP